ncbi:MAG: hypothetical protein ABJA74_10355 [Lapillicoccus sp.]
MRRWRGAPAGAGLVLALGACSGSGGISLPTNLPTTIPTSITITLPTIPPETPVGTKTETVTRTERPTTVTNTVTSTVTTTPAPQPELASSGLPLWVWVVLALLLIAVIVLVVWLVRRSQARTEWDKKLALARRNALWFEDSLVQQVMARGSTAEAWRTWQAAQPRLLSLDEMLYELSTTAPDEERAAQATGPDATVDDLRARRAAVWRARTELRTLLDAAAPARR